VSAAARPRRRPLAATPTRQKIVEAAVELFSTRGFHESSMRDIAGRVGIEAASLYAHYTGKEEILRTILESYRREIATMRLPDEALERIVAQHSTEAILIEGFETIRRGVSAPRSERILRLLFNEMFKNPLVGAFGLDHLRKTNIRELSRVFAAMRRRGKIRDLDPEVVAVIYNAIVNNYFQERFVLEACGRSTRALVGRTHEQLATLARVLAAASSKPD
jgi:AcrR family transcriptional regulator